MVPAIKIRRPSDWHTHVRQELMLEAIAKVSLRHYYWAKPMPNLVPPVLERAGMREYFDSIVLAIEDARTMLHMTFKITPETKPWMVRQISRDSIRASGKLYPDGVTTNSEGGVRDFTALYDVYEAMQEVDTVLNLHGELPGADPLYAEREFLETLLQLVHDFPALRIVLEHVSTADAIQAVLELPDTVAATITAHHPVLIHEDAMASGHNFCKPVAKTPKDRDAIIAAAVSGNPKFFFGSDSAPHPPETKHGDHPHAGVFSAPVAIPVLAEVFEQHGGSDWVDRLERFMSLNGCRFYGVPEPTEDDSLYLAKDPWQVPEMVGGVVPFKAGQTLGWRVLEPV